ncbi:MAG: hypothetical protein HQL77_07590 [Magnetococcales bacterium]|nr:hypothetical protein [Magnetococcales bacterium]
MSAFTELPSSIQTDLVVLRDRTTYLWPEILQACRFEGDTLTCRIRIKTFVQVEKALSNLSQAGYFGFHKVTNGHGENPQLIHLQILNISDRFKVIVNSMEPKKVAVVPARPSGFVDKIRSFFHLD